jgi:hypothetical protein
MDELGCVLENTWITRIGRLEPVKKLWVTMATAACGWRIAFEVENCPAQFMRRAA